MPNQKLIWMILERGTQVYKVSFYYWAAAIMLGDKYCPVHQIATKPHPSPMFEIGVN